MLKPIDSPTPSSTERRWVLWFALLVSLLTSLPYIIGAFAGNENWIFSGFIFGVEDANSYIANMLSGAAGNWLFRTPYTTQPQSGALIFLHYILLGKLTIPAGQHDQSVILYHLFRIFSIFMVCLATYQFIALFIPEISLRRWGLALGTLGGGLGWLILLFGWGEWLGRLPLSDIPGLNLPLALYSPETFGFLALYGIPHVALARALLLWGLKYYLELTSQETGAPFPWLKGALIGIIWLLTLLAQSLTGMVTGAVAGFYLLGLFIWQALRMLRGRQADWKRFWRALTITVWVGIFALPLVIYYITLFQQDSVMRLWNVQSPLPSPNPIFYLLAYGLMIPFAIYGGLRFIRHMPWKGFLPVSWVLALPILAYAPFNMQRRLVDGVWIALIVLSLGYVTSSFSSQNLAAASTTSRLRSWFYGLTSLGFVAALILIVGGITATLNPSPPLYRRADQVRAFNKLDRIAAPGDIALSSSMTGNPLPSYAPVRVVIGIETLTVAYEEVAAQVESFYQENTTLGQRQELLQKWGVDYVYWGPDERDLGNWDPNQEVFLEKIVTAGEHEIFRVMIGD
ncbi:hypothetical protein ACFLY4_09645 [Chloroflexota bacterium]